MPKKSTPKKGVSKRTVARKGAKKSVRTKTTTKKTAAKKTAAKETAAKKKAVKKRAVKSAATKKTAAKKSATKKAAKVAGPSTPKSFGGVIRGQTKTVQSIGKALRAVVFEELPDVTETFYGGQRPMSLYRTVAEVCWIQPLKKRCNIYFMQGPQLDDTEQILEGSSDRFRFAKVASVGDVERLPIRAWIQQSVALNEAATSGAVTFEEVHEKLQAICLRLPNTKETLTWGKPHFRVGEKIFCGCGENQGRPSMGLKMEPFDSQTMMKLPGIEKAPYSRKNDGWVVIDPTVFDDWDEITRFVEESFGLIAPKRLLT